MISFSFIWTFPAFFTATIVIFNFAFMAANNDLITIKIMTIDVV